MSQNRSHTNYLKSSLWLERHPVWLKQCDYRCSMFPWVRIGRKAKGKYHRYHIHHTHYLSNYQGNERLWLDVLPLCPFAHRLIHRGLGGSDRACDQRHRFPNTAQRMAHAWCRFPVVGKIVLLGIILGGLLSVVRSLAV